MELGSIANRTDALPQAVSLRGNEAAERIPDNEASESAGKAVAQADKTAAPLPSYAGTRIDTQA
jgi:hypothetical protein